MNQWCIVKIGPVRVPFVEEHGKGHMGQCGARIGQIEEWETSVNNVRWEWWWWSRNILCEHTLEKRKRREKKICVAIESNNELTEWVGSSTRSLVCCQRTNASERERARNAPWMIGEDQRVGITKNNDLYAYTAHRLLFLSSARASCTSVGVR